ncbi:hypothetical protein MODO_3293 [Myroides odoratimimus]|uniref:Uncharacterized protein n=1 Tax=Myroides odoratimimus CCUG 10230 TaxID=883150 RepID=A0ABN0E8P4_9FLAO|nr:DUF6266 family protein [Myroides odoratimimus]EHO07883.1 hypothetical protein HMPREF9712_02440 [Myroides odoratimimus CCUG 10230]MDM1520886.1 hypothetical protein [Myroides odoratimimus]GAQ15595.1 hypothetical protein MODO_3293 [Myroides odoratimimus]STZ48083.1 Uncharacterised protein [Myroides odoratimimus]
MAEIKEGILGAVVGKVGTVVGVLWRGRNILRAKPLKSSKKATEAQLKQWNKMSLVSTFASKFKDFVNAHCPAVYNGEKWMTGKEQMISRLMKQGIAIHEGEQYVQIDKVLLSIGTLAPAVIKKISTLKTGKLKVQWDNHLINPLTLDTDVLTIMAYHEELDKFTTISNIGQRKDRYTHFSLPKEWQEGKVYLWSMWKAEDGSVHSTSCFHGTLEMDIEGAGYEGTGNRETDNRETDNRETENKETGNRETDNMETGNEGTLVPITDNVSESSLPIPLMEEESITKKELPPGLIRQVRKKIIKEIKSREYSTRDNKHEGVIYEVRYVLEALKAEKEQRE